MENQTNLQYLPLNNEEKINYIKLCKSKNIKVECKLIEIDGKKVIGYKVLEEMLKKEEPEPVLEKPSITFIIEPIPVKQEEPKLVFVLPEINDNEIPTSYNNFQYCNNCQTERSHTVFRNIVKCNHCQKSYKLGL